MEYRWKLKMKYRWKLLKIKIRLFRKLAQLWIAGKLIKIAFWISRDLQKEMGYK